MYIVGINIGKRCHEAGIIDKKGILQEKSLRLSTSHTGFNKLLKSVVKTAGKRVRERGCLWY